MMMFLILFEDSKVPRKPGGTQEAERGPHRFIVKRASFFEDSTKSSLLLEAKDGGSIFKKLYLAILRRPTSTSSG